MTLWIQTKSPLALPDVAPHPSGNGRKGKAEGSNNPLAPWQSKAAGHYKAQMAAGDPDVNMPSCLPWLALQSNKTKEVIVFDNTVEVTDASGKVIRRSAKANENKFQT